MPAPLSRPLDSVLYHKYLRGQPFSPSSDSLLSTSSPSVEDVSTTLEESDSFHWDLRATSRNLTPAFDYISQKLSEEGLSINLIVSDHSPFVIPVWPLPRKSQIELARIVRKACKKFDVKANWMTALGSMNKKEMARAFDAYQPDSYVVRRSIVQGQIIYSQESFTLLAIDHIYTLKQLLCTLSKPDWVSQHARQVCLSSCVQLLDRIHTIYTGKTASKGYIARVYPEISFQADEFDEVVGGYNSNYCTATIHDVAFQPDFSSMVAEDSSKVDRSLTTTAELPEHPAFRSSSTEGHERQRNNEEIISPLADVDLSTLDSWDRNTTMAGMDNPPSADKISPIEITYPPVKRPSSAEQQQPDSLPPPAPRSTLHPDTTNNSNAGDEEGPDAETEEPPTPPPPSPLKINKKPSTSSMECHISPPSTDVRLPRKSSLNIPPLLPSTVFSDAIESAGSPPSQQHIAFPLPPTNPTLHKHNVSNNTIIIEENDPERKPEVAEESQIDTRDFAEQHGAPAVVSFDIDEELMEDDHDDDTEYEDLDDLHVQVETMLDLHQLNGGSGRMSDGGDIWQSADIPEDPRAYIESWSSGVVRECSPPAHLPGPPPSPGYPVVIPGPMGAGGVPCF